MLINYIPQLMLPFAAKMCDDDGKSEHNENKTHLLLNTLRRLSFVHASLCKLVLIIYDVEHRHKMKTKLIHFLNPHENILVALSSSLTACIKTTHSITKHTHRFFFCVQYINLSSFISLALTFRRQNNRF